MKVLLLAGGYGTRISEESQFKPKPMVELGGMPILWHIMKKYAAQGFREFVICAGYKIDMIKDYFKDFYIYQSDITVDLRTNTIKDPQECVRGLEGYGGGYGTLFRYRTEGEPCGEVYDGDPVLSLTETAWTILT